MGWVGVSLGVFACKLRILVWLLWVWFACVLVFDFGLWVCLLFLVCCLG